MNKSSLLFFGVLMVFIAYLYNVFPLGEPTEVSQVEPAKEVVIEEVDPMEQMLEPSEVEEEALDEDDLTEEEEAKRLAEEQENTEQEDEDIKKKEEERKKKEEEEKRKKEEELKKRAEDEMVKSPNIKKIEKIIKYSRSKLGKPYRQAGVTDKGYDCSGLIMTSFAKQNVKLPRASYQMAKKGTVVKLKNIKKGDLLFFGTKSEAPKRISHVAMVTKVKDSKIYFIHSSEKAGVILNTMNEGYYKKRFLKAKRYLK